MKKFLFITIGVIFAFNLNAQKYGLRLGGNFAGMLSTVETKGTKIAPGLQIGLLTEFGANRVGLRIEANYAQKGFDIDYNENIENVGVVIKEAKVNFSYLEVPVLLKVKLVGPLYVHAGPYFGLALKGNMLTESYSIAGVVQELGDAEDVNILEISDYNSVPYKKTDFGAAMGLGAQFGLGPVHAFVEGRATIGLSNLYDTESQAYKDLVIAGAYKDTDHLKNMVFSVALGIVLGK